MRFKLYQTQQRQSAAKTCLRNPKYATDLFNFYEMHLHTGTGICRPHMGGKNVCNSQSEEKNNNNKERKVKSLSQC